MPRGSRETRECFSALILKVRFHEGKNSSNYGGIVLFRFLFFFLNYSTLEIVPII